MGRLPGKFDMHDIDVELSYCFVCNGRFRVPIFCVGGRRRVQAVLWKGFRKQAQVERKNATLAQFRSQNVSQRLEKTRAQVTPAMKGGTHRQEIKHKLGWGRI